MLLFLQRGAGRAPAEMMLASRPGECERRLRAMGSACVE